MPNVPYSYEVNAKLVTGNGFLIPISSLTKRSLLPSLTVLFSGTLGDLVILNEDEDFVAEEIRKLLKDGAVYKEEIARPMLGKTYFVVPTESELFDENWVGLLNDDGEELYFPKTTVKKVECSKWT
mgnify:CR=1 FL=1